jgi:hypothetical protein
MGSSHFVHKITCSRHKREEETDCHMCKVCGDRAERHKGECTWKYHAMCCWKCNVGLCLEDCYEIYRSEVRVTLQLTVGQSVCLGVEPRLGLMTRCLTVWQLRSCPIQAPSLTRGWVCRLSVSLRSDLLRLLYHSRHSCNSWIYASEVSVIHLLDKCMLYIYICV